MRARMTAQVPGVDCPDSAIFWKVQSAWNENVFAGQFQVASWFSCWWMLASSEGTRESRMKKWREKESEKEGKWMGEVSQPVRWRAKT